MDQKIERAFDSPKDLEREKSLSANLFFPTLSLFHPFQLTTTTVHQQQLLSDNFLFLFASEKSPARLKQERNYSRSRIGIYCSLAYLSINLFRKEEKKRLTIIFGVRIIEMFTWHVKRGKFYLQSVFYLNKKKTPKFFHRRREKRVIKCKYFF